MVRCFRSLLLSILLFTLAVIVRAQELPPFGFVRATDIRVADAGNRPLAFPFAGGMNSVRAAQIDLNSDGVLDLLFFEKHGNRLLPFLSTSHAPNTMAYQYAPHYVHAFPKLHNWALFHDYNGDGKVDIFTYGLAGITVYKNISTQGDLAFELVTDQLQSFYYNGYTNLYTSPDDYLAIVDLDHDGDLDILNFWLLGKYVHYHRNYAIENHGTADSFDFRLEEECWGEFEEGADNNSITLFSPCGVADKSAPKHIGSTLFAYDFTGNGLLDLVIGDVDYPNLILLRNGGTSQNALMTSQDTLFPTPAEPIWLFSMPVINMLDVDNDGIAEMIASPSDPSFTKSQDLNSVWLYKKEMQSGDFQIVTRSFLQGEMIDVGSGAYPVLFDWSGDGLLDLFVANYGRFDSAAYHNGFLTSYFASSIAYYENVGTATAPAFRLVTHDFANLQSHNYQALYPAFGDLNGDGRPDLLCGQREGTLFYLECIGDNQFSTPQQLTHLDVGDYSTPQLFDIDQDGVLELLVGNRRGQISYWRRQTPDSLDFQLITPSFGNVDVRDENISYFGYAVSYFFRYGDDTYLFCGDEQGNLSIYADIDDNLGGTFRYVGRVTERCDNRIYPLREGVRTAPALADLNGDGYPDLLVGNYAGGLSYFAGETPTLSLHDSFPLAPPCRIYPNPAHHHCNISFPDLQKVILYDLSGKMILQKNIPATSSYTLDLSGLSPGFYLCRVEAKDLKQTFKLVVQ